jgi:uncharacterized protein YkwD
MPAWLRCLLAIVVAMVLGAACVRPQGATGRIDPGRESSAASATPDDSLSIRFPGPPASTYRTDLLEDPDSPVARAVRRTFPRLRIDRCLERAARAHLQIPLDRADRTPLAFTEAALHWAGCPDPSATVTTVLSSDVSVHALLRRIDSLVTEHAYTHLGLARADARPPYRSRWVALLVDRRVQIRPLPTSADPGTRLPLLFRLDPAFARATVAVTRPDGDVHEVDVGFSDGWGVASLRLGGTVGTQWVELMGHNSSGPRVLALFPVEVGRRAPDRFVGSLLSDESWLRSREQAEEYAAELVERDRHRFGLPPLQRDPTLDQVARAHSEDMAAAGYFAHISPTTGSVADRLRRRDYPATFAAENIAMAGGLAEAEDGLMRSPEHRAAILTRRATHVGIGVATTESGDLGKRYLVTQVFAATSDAYRGQP